MSVNEVAAAVRRRSFDLPGGSVKTGGGEILLRTKGQAYRGADFEGILLRSRRDGTQLWLRDVAPVVDGFAETDTEGLFDGKPSVLIQVFRVGDQNALEISKTVHKFVSAKKARLSRMPSKMGILNFDCTLHRPLAIDSLTAETFLEAFARV